MTSTHTPAEATGAAAAEHGSAAPAGVRPYAPPTGVAAWLATSDHKRVGRLYVACSLLFGAGALVIGALVAADKIDDSAAFLRLGSVGQLISVYRFLFAFGVVVPLLLGLGFAVVPLQIGAQGIAFPRLAAMSFWGWLAGTGMMIGAYAGNGGPGGGDYRAVDLFLSSLGVVVVSLTVAAICLATTVITMRPPGMGLDRVPAFTWSIFATSAVLVLSLPILLATIVLLTVDHRYASVVFEGSNGVGRFIEWGISQPQTYLYAVPVLGFAADVIATFARRRLPLRGVVFTAIGLAAVLGFGAEMQTAFNAETHHQFLYLLVGLSLALPVLVVLGACALAIKEGRLTVSPPFIFAVLALLVMLAGAAAGAFSGWRGLNLDGTVYGVGQSNLVLGAGLVAGLGGIVYWWPKLTGRAIGRASGVVALLAAGGAILVGGADIVLGFAKEPFGEVNNLGTNLSSAFNTVGFVGFVLALLAILATGALLAGSWRSGEAVGDDPWGGQTLEWATTSPPAVTNFPEPVGAVRSAEPLVDLKSGTAEATR